MTLSKPCSWNGHKSDSSGSLTHSGRDKMAAIIQMTFSNAFLWWKCMNFDYNFTEVCSQGSSLQYSIIGLDNGLAPNRRQAIIWTNDGLCFCHIYASLGLNELKFHRLPRCKKVTYACTSLCTHFIDSMWPSDALWQEKIIAVSSRGQWVKACDTTIPIK